MENHNSEREEGCDSLKSINTMLSNIVSMIVDVEKKMIETQNNFDIVRNGFYRVEANLDFVRNAVKKIHKNTDKDKE